LSGAFCWLAEVAPEFGGSLTQSTDQAGRMILPVLLVDGRTIRYALELRESGGEVSVREEAPQHLPSFCPERHINSDGTFCLNYSPVQPLKVEDESTARAWMETLYKFLKLQQRAQVMRKWPNDKVWAHGGAAHHQMRALIALNGLGDHIARAYSSHGLTVRRLYSKGRALLELRNNGECLYRVWEATQKVANQRRRCFCGISGRRRPLALRKCANHGEQAAELAFAMRDWEREEERYWATMKDKQCCGTCAGCPLAVGP